MKFKIMTKFILAYLVIAAASFLLISFFGSKLVEDRLISNVSLRLYNQARDIVSGFSSSSLAGDDDIYYELKAIATYQDSQIWLMDSDGKVSVDTALSSDAESFYIDGFDRVSLGSSYYYTGNFFGYFDDDVLTVITPVSRNYGVSGYLLIHMPMSRVYENRESYLAILHIIAIILFVFNLVILTLIFKWVIRPVNKITKGAALMANGDLNTKIEISSDDEMGYLADTLNYMASEMNKANDYQHKFIANVSHDLRSPLTSIKGYAVAMQDGTIPVELQGKYLGIVISEAERLNKLTQEMLTLDQMDPQTRLLNPVSFNINKMLKDVAASFEGMCRTHNVTLELLLEGDTLMVFADHSKIQQVVYNLLDNAIKFSRSGSSVKIESSERRGRALISVKDQGIGISSADLPKIWDRFYKTDASRGKDKRGTGLGLAIVKEIISAHNQKINVVSTEGVGTEFTFTLDLSQKQSEDSPS